jgi:Mce-associated membrane protein
MKPTMAGVLGGLIILCVSATVWFSFARSPGPSNTALVDVAGTNAVTDQVGRTLRTVFSYDPGQMDRTSVAAQEVLTGAAMQQYNTDFAAAKQHAAETKQVLTTAVRSIGVTELSGNSARLLVFIDRQTVQGDKHESAAAQLLITAEKAGEVWKISDIRFL